MTTLYRRNFAAGTIALAATTLARSFSDAAEPERECVWPPPAWKKGGFPSRCWVHVLNVQTGDRFKNIYCEDGNYILPSVQQFSWVCRDWRANEWKLLDARLLDLLFVLHWKYCRNEIRIISGYLTPESAILPVDPQQFEGSHANGQHEQGRALAIHLPDIDNEAVGLDFRTFVYGGIGTYPGRDFVHFDMGPKRRWVRQPKPDQDIAQHLVPLTRTGGVYAASVSMNGVVRLPFTVDSGATDVLIPADVALSLARAGTIAPRDFIGAQLYSLADGSTIKSARFILRELKVGDQVVQNIIASIGSVRSEPLLGQSFLSRFTSWTLDNERHALPLGNLRYQSNFPNRLSPPKLLSADYQRGEVRLRADQVSLTHMVSHTAL